MGLLARAPGTLWGYNFPTGWYGHHVDELSHLVLAETLINPLMPPRRPPHPYPKGLAAHVVIPTHGMRLAEGKLLVKDRSEMQQPPDPMKTIFLGRGIKVLYGTATILLFFLFARRLFQDVRVALFAAWILALGGLHVTQSHFFVADVPGLFWLLAGCYLLLLQLEQPDKQHLSYFLWASFSFGVAFGVKLVVMGLPTLALIALLHPRRYTAVVHGAVFFLAGFVVINFGSYTPYDLYKTFVRGVNDPFEWSFVSNLRLYLIELPAIVSFPVLLLSLSGAYALGRRAWDIESRESLVPLLLIVGLPLAIHGGLVVFKLDHFPRHLVPFIPWFSLLAAWSLVQIADTLRSRGMHAAWVVVPLFAYLALFVYDGEKVFLKEPRNQAARWIQQNIPQGTIISWSGHGNFTGYPQRHFPEETRPAVVVIEMHRANHYLSGMGWRDSYPRDHRFIFGARIQARVDEWQSLFKGTSEYKEAARFREGYFMPEYVLSDRLIGNRSRNYISEIVIFTNEAKLAETQVGADSSISTTRDE